MHFWNQQDAHSKFHRGLGHRIMFCRGWVHSRWDPICRSYGAYSSPCPRCGKLRRILQVRHICFEVWHLHFWSSKVTPSPFFQLQKFRQYAHFVIAGIQFLKSVTMFISPLLVAWFVKTESDKAEWRMLFLGMAAVLFVVWTFADFQTKFHNTIFGPFHLWSHFTTYTFLETKFIITLLSF